MSGDVSTKARTRTSYKYFLTYRTRWFVQFKVSHDDAHFTLAFRSDNDQYSHINNSIYYHFFDSIVNTYLIEECGLVPSTQDDQLIGLVVSSHCQFFAPLSFPQVLELGLRVNKVGKSSVEYEIGVFQKGVSAASAVGGYTHVFVAKGSRKPLKDGMGEKVKNGLTKLLHHQTEQAVSTLSKL